MINGVALFLNKQLGQLVLNLFPDCLFICISNCFNIVTLRPYFTAPNKIVHFGSLEYRDKEAKTPMTNDAIFRIYSMSKPITGVAMMILYEEGKFKLSDPVEKYIPEFADLQVAAGEDAAGNIITAPANHKMTIRDLMSHSGGLSYGLFSQSKVDDLYNDANVLDADSTLQDMIDKLGKIPLRQQPGSMWHYSVSVDVQGYLVEKLSGQKFGDFL